MTKPNSRAYRPQPAAIRAALVELPAEGCTLPVPDLPKSREWNDVEQARWVELWESPQATQWTTPAGRFRGVVALLVQYESRLLTGDNGAVAAPVVEAQSVRRTRMTLHDFDLFKGHIKWRDNVPVYVYEYPAGQIYEGADAVAFVHDLNERWLSRNPNA